MRNVLLTRSTTIAGGAPFGPPPDRERGVALGVSAPVPIEMRG
jgi:hypothetical protein